MKILANFDGNQKKDRTIAIALFAVISIFFISSSCMAQTTTTSTACGQTITYPNDGCASPLCTSPITIINNGTQNFTTDNDTICVQNSSVGTLNLQGHNNDVIRLCGTNSITGIGTNFGTGNAFINTSGSTLNLDYTGFGHTNHLYITNYGTLNLSGSTNYDATTIYNVGSAAVIITSGDFIVNGDDSIFMIGGTLTINGTFQPNNATALFCLSKNANISAVNVVVNDADEIHVDPGSSSCLRYTGTASANSNITEDNFAVCMAPGATPIQSFQTWGPNVTVTQNCSSCSSLLPPLPIILQSFVANLSSNNTVLLHWVSSYELDASRFDIERSNNGASFETIGSVNATGHNGTSTVYNYTDSLPLPGVDYYRLKMIDKDGKYNFSATLLVTPQTSRNKLRVLANTHSNLVIGLPQIIGAGLLRLIDLQGRVLWSQHADINMLQVNIPLSGMASGNYFLQYIDNKMQQTLQVYIH